MYSQPEEVMEKYDLTVEQITKGRGVYICDTSQGKKLLTPFGGSEERAEFLGEFLRYLGDAGFPAEQIICTGEGTMLAEDEGGTAYLLKDMVAGSECSTRNREEMREAVCLMARFHQLSMACPLTIPPFLGQTRETGLSRCEKHVRELILVKNYVRTRKKKNEFERMFAAHYPHFMGTAQEALRLLKQQTKEEDRCICHGDFNQHNVLHTRGGLCLINYEHFCYDVPMTDLANYLRKMMEKNDWKEELGHELIAAYDRIRAIGSTERQQLYVMLLFPEKFWKIANHYGNSHKAWLGGRDLEKLERVIRQEPARMRFLEGIFR